MPYEAFARWEWEGGAVAEEADPQAPVVAAVEPDTARATAETAARLARRLEAPLVFVHVRRDPPAVLGEPGYQRRLTDGLGRGRRALDAAFAASRREGVTAYGEIVAGDAADRVLDFAQRRNARLLVVGQRRRRLGRSVSRRVLDAAELPVVVASR